MATWASIYDELILQLGTDVQWDSGELRMYVNRAIRIYSEYFPLGKSTELTTDGSTKSWDVPSDFLWARLVECPADTFLEEIKRKPGTAFYSATSGLPNMYYVESGKLYLTYAPSTSDTLTLHYAASHTEFSTSVSQTTVPDRDLELLALYAASRALIRVAVSQARADRYKSKALDAGNPEQNPITPVKRDLTREFWEGIYRRLPKGNVEFHRKGRGE